MTTEEIIKILKDDQDNVDFDWLKEEAQPVFDAYSEAIKAVEVVDKIKKAYSHNWDSAAFTKEVHDILCTAYGSDEDKESWIWESEV